MRLSTYRLSDYRLAAYVVAAAIIGGTIAFALDRATAPSTKIEANVAPPASGAVRQIPISRTTAADLGDPQGKLTPVYPAAPGKDLPIKDTPVVQAVKPPAETNGNANASGQTASPAPAAAPSVASGA
jgi:type IV secretory pathway VirJ component